MSAFLIAERYARALSESIEDSGELETVLANIGEFESVYQENEEVRIVLSNPAIPPQAREGVFDGLVTSMALHPSARNILKALFLRQRITLITQVVSIFGKLVDERLNRITAQITTATELTPEAERSVQEGLAAFSGKTVSLETTRDPEILGGVVAQLGSIIIDGSLRAQMNQLKLALLAEEK